MKEGIEKLVDLAATDYRGLVARRVRLYAVYGAAGMFALMAVLALAGAAGIWLAERYGPVNALLIVAAALLAIALALAVSGMMIRQSQLRTEELLRQNRRMAMMGALSLVASTSSRRPAALLVAIGAILALRRMIFGRG
ncbi:MAG: phage holin family protein [Nitratireductor sp.]|jgi:hypothetical protein|nr:phage holin family protein [Nitratireductor sp.]